MREALRTIREVRTTPETPLNARAAGAAIDVQRAEGSAELSEVLDGVALEKQLENLDVSSQGAIDGTYKQLSGSTVVNSILDRVSIDSKMAVRANVTDSVRQAILNEEGQWVESEASAERIANVLIDRDASGQLKVIEVRFEEVTEE
ncbi:hypothetical protein ACFVX3_31305 [Rhodococcus erythropolis]